MKYVRKKEMFLRGESFWIWQRNMNCNNDKHDDNVARVLKS